MYAEHWLQEEVFPHFRDLANQSVSLKDYFADPKVQAYLEALPLEAETANEWVVVQPRSGKPSARLQPTAGIACCSTPTIGQAGSQYRHLDSCTNRRLHSSLRAEIPGNGGRAETGAAVSLPTATAGQPPDSTSKPRRRKNSGRRGASGKGLTGDLVDRTRTQAAQISAKVKSMPRNRLALFLVAGVVSLLFLWLILSLLASAIQALSGPSLEGEQARVGLEAPRLEIPPVSAAPEPSAPASGAMTEEAARDLVQSWLSAKAAALGLSTLSKN